MQHENVIMERHKMRIEDVITITMGTPQFRIKESLLDSAAYLQLLRATRAGE